MASERKAEISATGTGKDNKGLVIPVLEHLPFKGHQFIEKFHAVLSARWVFWVRDLPVDENGPFIAV